MRRKSRFERKKEYRDKRLERAVKNLEGKNIPKKKMSKGNRITLFVIVAVFIGMNFFSIRHEKKTFNFDKEEFKGNYEVFIKENENKFSYDKTIKSIIKNKNEYSFLQESSQYTGSLVAIYQTKNKVQRLAVVGVPKGNLDFEKAYKENMVIISGLIFDKDYDDSEQFLRTIQILDKEGNIIKGENVLKAKFEEIELTFSYNKNNIIFNIENE